MPLCDRYHAIEHKFTGIIALINQDQGRNMALALGLVLDEWDRLPVQSKACLQGGFLSPSPPVAVNKTRRSGGEPSLGSFRGISPGKCLEDISRDHITHP